MGYFEFNFIIKVILFSLYLVLCKLILKINISLENGIRFLTGTQALVRIPLVQIRKDRKNNLNTACYISGYRGSPLGAYDQQILKNIEYLKV